ncbi:MAG: hypothetical protein ACJA0Q_000171 [Saprospiraceae bacterium]|jgi:hypothetical protein
MKRLCIVLVFAFKLSCAQNNQVEQALFFLMERHEANIGREDTEVPDGVTLFEDFESRLQVYFNDPLKINTCTLLQLLDFPLFNKQQVFHVVSYRRRYGDFRSLKEMSLLPQFSVELLKVLAPFLEFSGGIKTVNKRTKVRLLGTCKYLFGKDISSIDYLGSNVYQAFKLEVLDVFPRYSFAMNAEKDRGEVWYHSSTGIEHANFYLSYKKETSTLNRLVLGTYKVSFGQGLVLHSGYNSYKSRFLHSGGSFNKVKIKPQSSNQESSYLKGVAGVLTYGNFELSILASMNKMDATVYKDSLGEFFSSVGTSGMHSDESSISKKDKVAVNELGFSAEYMKDKVNVSWNHLYAVLSMPFRRNTNYYNSEYLTGSEFYTQSLDFNYLWGQVHFFGEIAMDKELDFAVLTGVSGTIAELFNYNVLYRNYGKSFQSFKGQSYQQNGQLRNEKGLVGQVDGRFGAGFSYHGFYDVYLFPEMSYGKRFSAIGKEQALRISYKNENGFECYAKVKSKAGQRNIAQGNTYQQKDEKRSSFRFNYRLHVNESFRVGGQFEYSYYSSDTSNSTGVLIFQELKHTVRNFTYGPRITVFSIDDYNARIYVYEPSLKYSSPFLFFKDIGFSLSAKIKYQIDKHFCLSAKLYSTFLQSRELVALRFTKKSGVNIQCYIKF